MSIKDLHNITKNLIEQGRGNATVAIDSSEIEESECGASILPIASGKYRNIRGVDDSGPVGPRFPFFILKPE